jgi:hypothetical protein
MCVKQLLEEECEEGWVSKKKTSRPTHSLDITLHTASWEIYTRVCSVQSTGTKVCSLMCGVQCELRKVRVQCKACSLWIRVGT